MNEKSTEKKAEAFASTFEFEQEFCENFAQALCPVCYLKGKSEPFRLRLVLLAAIRSADFPLFSPSPACSQYNYFLGQKWNEKVVDNIERFEL